MTTKIRSNIYLDANLKQQAKELFKSYGLSLSDGINMLLKQVTEKKNPILIPGLDIEVVGKNEPDYELMRKTDNEETYSLEEVKELLCK
jgi:addiction module RelB/DinJ family antitoxin